MTDRVEWDCTAAYTHPADMLACKPEEVIEAVIEAVIEQPAGQPTFRMGVWGSYHFESNTSAYVSYTQAEDKGWRLSDGSVPPNRKYFTHTHYDDETRTFCRTIDWRPTDFAGVETWTYEIEFAADMSCIVGGKTPKAQLGACLTSALISITRNCAGNVPEGFVPNEMQKAAVEALGPATDPSWADIDEFDIRAARGLCAE